MAWSDSEQKFENTLCEELYEEHNNFLAKHLAQAKRIRPPFRIAQEAIHARFSLLSSTLGWDDRFHLGRLNSFANVWRVPTPVCGLSDVNDSQCRYAGRLIGRNLVPNRRGRHLPRLSLHRYKGNQRQWNGDACGSYSRRKGHVPFSPFVSDYLIAVPENGNRCNEVEHDFLSGHLQRKENNDSAITEPPLRTT